MGDIIKQTADYVKRELLGETTGHDWKHTYRVWQTAKYIGQKERADLTIVQLSALLHDIADWKLHKKDMSIGLNKTKDLLEKLGTDEKLATQVYNILEDIDFKGSEVEHTMKTIEGKCVYDADKLDAMGAIGIARAFATGQKLNQEFYNPKKPVVKHKSFEDYQKTAFDGSRTVVNHFYEKLLILKDKMNTETGRRIAESRHKFMEDFLNEFFKEWNLEDIK